MLVLAIWLFLIGYTVAITGKRNLSVSYTPQADGSIKPVDDVGNPAKTYSLLEVVSCAGRAGATGATGTASVSEVGKPGPLTAQTAVHPRSGSYYSALPPPFTPPPDLAPVSGPTAGSLRQQLNQIPAWNQPSGPFDVVGQIGKFLTNVWDGLRSLF